MLAEAFALEPTLLAKLKDVLYKQPPRVAASRRATRNLPMVEDRPQRLRRARDSGKRA